MRRLSYHTSYHIIMCVCMLCGSMNILSILFVYLLNCSRSWLGRIWVTLTRLGSLSASFKLQYTFVTYTYDKTAAFTYVHYVLSLCWLMVRAILYDFYFLRFELTLCIWGKSIIYSSHLVYYVYGVKMQQNAVGVRSCMILLRCE